MSETPARPHPTAIRFPPGLLGRLDAAVDKQNEDRPPGTPKVTRNSFVAAAVEAQLADRPRPTVPVPLGHLPEEARPRAPLSPPMAGPPAARPRKGSGMPVYEVQHRQVASVHQWRLDAEHARCTAMSRMAVTSDARALLRERGIEPPFEVKLVPWVE